ncbi:hypothetical protein [Nostoc sp.]|uniref:hypothetical protein n=1 Tax=Nostoc sp. TaxID=1180 RepID=UPI002FF5F2A2
MEYSDFTLEKVSAVLGITTQEADLFPKLVPLSIPSCLNETLGKRTQLALISEKALYGIFLSLEQLYIVLQRSVVLLRCLLLMDLTHNT